MRRFIVYLVIFITFLVTAPFSSAQELASPDRITIKAPINLVVNSDPQARTPKEDLLSEITTRHFAPEELTIDYNGLQGLIVDRIQSQYNRLWGMYVDNVCDTLTLEQIDRLFSNQSWAWHDHDSGQWWLRSWRESLVSEKGGAEDTIVYSEGKTLEVFDFAGISVANDGRIALGEIRFLFDAIRPQSESDSYNINLKNTKFLGGVQVGPGHNKEGVDVTFRQSITLKGTTIPTEVLSCVTLEFRVKILSSRLDHPLISLVAGSESSPFQNIYSFRFNVDVGIW